MARWYDCPFMRHVRPILALIVAQVSVFAYLLFADVDGIPFRLIPWDFRSLFAPWLIYGWDAVRAGFLPLWCPYVGGGAAYFLNPQTSLYSPLSILLGPLFGYSFRLAQVHCVLMMLIGGIGVYILAHSIWQRRSAALFSGLCFELSSALFGHLEHQTILAAYALTPWVFWAILMTFDSRSLWGPLLMAWFVYWILSTGYPGVILMLTPWAVAFAIALLFRRPIAFRQRVRLVGSSMVAVFVGIGMAAVSWLPFAVHRTELTRNSPMTIDAALASSLSPTDVLGMLWSFNTAHPLPGTTLDISMRGVYFGAVAVALAAVCLVWARGWIVKALSALTIGSLLMALGGAFAGGVMLHLLVPVFNLSRFPAGDNRGMTIMALSILAGGGAVLIAKRETPAFHMARTAIRYLLVFYLVSFIGVQWIYGKAFVAAIATFSFEAVCMLLALVVLARTKGTQMILCLAGIAFLETSYSAMTNFTVIGHPVAAPAYASLTKHEKSFSTAGVGVPRVGNGANTTDESSVEGYVAKKFHINEYNPIRLGRFNTLIGAGFLPWMQNGPRVVALPPGSTALNYADFSPKAKPVQYSILEYTPNQVRYQIQPTDDALLVFNEVYFPGWKATVDGQPTPVRPLLTGLRTLTVKGGSHEIVFTFRPTSYFVALGISIASFLVFLAWAILLRSRIKKGQARLPVDEQPTLFLGECPTEI
jgi:hypothetical protein